MNKPRKTAETFFKRLSDSERDSLINKTEKDFFEKLSDMDRIFWSTHTDRQFTSTKLFPLIGEYLKSNEPKRLLDIGIQGFNLADKDLLQNDKVEFYGLDKYSDSIKGEGILNETCIPEGWEEIMCSDLITADLFTNTKLRRFFDVIVDYGVLGWDGANENWTTSHLENYIKNILDILKDNGLYFLKIDLKGRHKEIRDIVFKHFDLKPFHDVSYVSMKGYKCFTLQKKKVKNILNDLKRNDLSGKLIATVKKKNGNFYIENEEIDLFRSDPPYRDEGDGILDFHIEAAKTKRTPFSNLILKFYSGGIQYFTMRHALDNIPPDEGISFWVSHISFRELDELSIEIYGR
ncbi:MAG TPA: hypothetical protein EYG21_03970 [Nitrospinaceae bacterium]|nr:hypothetical protein [Nitrospinaceae bacterium]